MLRTDKLYQWAPTQMHMEPAKPLPKGCDQQGRYPCAAEPCTDIGADQDDDSNPIPGAGAFVVPALVAFIAFCAAGLHVWARWFA